MKLSKLIFVGSLSLSLLATSSPVFAEEVKDGGAMDSLADVTFVENTGSVKPINPVNPDQEVKPNPNDPHKPGTAGPLSIDYVSNIHFGSQTITGNNIYYAKLDTVQTTDGQDNLIQVPNYVQVTDTRGTNVGWKLTVKQNGQFETASNEILTNAELKLTNPSVASSTDQEFAPVAQAVTLDPAGAVQEVATAAQGKGMWTWTIAYGNSNEVGKESISLFVPTGTSIVKDELYSTSLTWILEDTPI